ncbi:hypothetical protein D3C80_2089150 [compost metagenome]
MGSGLSYSSMPSKAWPMVWSVVPLDSPLRVAKISQVSASRVKMVSRDMYQLQKVVIRGCS